MTTKPAPLKGRTWNPYTIPDVIDPGNVRCVKVYIPDSLQWLQIFAAVMDTMCHWKNYELLGDTSAAQCAALMRSINQQYNTFERCDECPPSTIIDELEYEMSLCEQLRFQNGKLQGLCCGEWSDIDGQPAQGWMPGTIGTGTTPPSAGGCEDYNASISGSGYWYAPFVVSTGDTILISSAVGATYNPANGGWYCPDGSLFFAGGCLPSTLTAGGNPMPAILSGKLIAKIGATYYDVYNGTFTVPAGISTQPIQFQFNYASIATSSGDVSFAVHFCNNATATFTHTFDFTVTDAGWVAYVPIPGGVFTPGTGWVAASSVIGGSINNRWVNITKTFSSRTITSVVATFDYVRGTIDASQTHPEQIANATQYWLNELNAACTTGTNQVKGGAASYVSTSLQVLLQCHYNTGAVGSANAILKRLVVQGLGSDPF